MKIHLLRGRRVMLDADLQAVLAALEQLTGPEGEGGKEIGFKL